MSTKSKTTSQKQTADPKEGLTRGGRRERRSWSTAETQKVIEFLLSTIRKGREIEKPNANAYYEKALADLHLPFCKVSQIKNYVKNLKNQYIAAVKWRDWTRCYGGRGERLL